MENVDSKTTDQEEQNYALYDADGYFFQALKAVQEADNDAVLKTMASLVLDDPSLLKLQHLYYLEVRSGMVLVCKSMFGPFEEKFMKAIDQWRKNSYWISMILTHIHLSNQSAITPSWLDFYLGELQEVLEGQYPTIRKVNFKVSVEPRFKARTISSNRIEISAFTRTLLRHYNMIIWNLIEAEITSGEQINLSMLPDIQGLARMILPYLIFSYEHMPVGRLYSSNWILRKELFLVVLNITKLQVMFIIAHELGHIILGHTQKKCRNDLDKLHFEREADQFAFKAVLQVVQLNKHLTVGDLWIAVRWLYQYQLLDEVVGNLLTKETIVLEDLRFDIRKNDMYSLLPKEQMSRDDNLLEMRGTLMLMSLKHVLIELGYEFLKFVSNELVNLIPGENVFWWTKITNSDPSSTVNADF